MNFLPFYKFPSTVVILMPSNQDNQDIDKLCENLDIRTKCFTHPQDALTFINKSNPFHLPALQNTADRLFNYLQFSQDPNKFNSISCIMTSYTLSGINGIEFCKEIQLPNIKKIVLASTNNEQLAINAFNKGIIDYFIVKDAPNSSHQIVEFIQDAINRFFLDSTNDIAESIIHATPSPIKKEKYQDFLAQLIHQKQITEYYLTDESGFFIGRTNSGNNIIIQTFTKAALTEYINHIQKSEYWNKLPDLNRQEIISYKKILFFLSSEPLLVDLQTVPYLPEIYVTIYPIPTILG